MDLWWPNGSWKELTVGPWPLWPQVWFSGSGARPVGRALRVPDSFTCEAIPARCSRRPAATISSWWPWSIRTQISDEPGSRCSTRLAALPDAGPRAVGRRAAADFHHRVLGAPHPAHDDRGPGRGPAW